MYLDQHIFKAWTLWQSCNGLSINCMPKYPQWWNDQFSEMCSDYFGKNDRLPARTHLYYLGLVYTECNLYARIHRNTWTSLRAFAFCTRCENIVCVCEHMSVFYYSRMMWPGCFTFTSVSVPCVCLCLYIIYMFACVRIRVCVVQFSLHADAAPRCRHVHTHTHTELYTNTYMPCDARGVYVPRCLMHMCVFLGALSGLDSWQ